MKEFDEEVKEIQALCEALQAYPWPGFVWTLHRLKDGQIAPRDRQGTVLGLQGDLALRHNLLIRELERMEGIRAHFDHVFRHTLGR